MAQAALPWPAEPAAQAVNLTSIEGPGTNDFYTDMSGAVWNPAARRLWVCRNGPGGAASKFWALRESGSTFEVDSRGGVRGEWTGFGDLEGITVADYDEDTVYLMIEGEERIKEYDVSTYGVAILRNNWNTSTHLPLSGGSGAEGIAFVPDSFLAAQGFVNSAGVPYTSQNGMGGLMFVAHQNGGRVYVFDLNRTNGTFIFVGAYRTNYAESCELAFDRSEGLLYIFHGNINTVQIVRLSSTLSGGERYFNEIVTYAAPFSGNLEGIAVVENGDCTPTGRRFFLLSDGGGANSVFMFNAFPCCISNPDSDGDGVSDCADQCPDSPPGSQVDPSGCACSQLDADGDGVSDCDDQCPDTESGALVSADGCTCFESDADADGVDDCRDACPGSQPGLLVDADGCNCEQKDYDGDGVADCLDACSSTGAGEAVDMFGCACVQLDSDADGINDCFDQCPDSAAGLPVNANGCNCAQLDGDGDGVNDCNDSCPDTPPGADVDENGCPRNTTDVSIPRRPAPARIGPGGKSLLPAPSPAAAPNVTSRASGTPSAVADASAEQAYDVEAADVDQSENDPFGGLRGLGAVQALASALLSLAFACRHVGPLARR